MDVSCSHSPNSLTVLFTISPILSDLVQQVALLSFVDLSFVDSLTIPPAFVRHS